ncbi:hypothetical protein [Nocardia yamanashiensis]|uniref:hypothetical protein n=1 Tax=Nocardia yamanashiensis TaxID=209247 RepID=UPI000AE02026|nr:hypothetical protein [Nocardia yamanashiensis]
MTTSPGLLNGYEVVTEHRLSELGTNTEFSHLTQPPVFIDTGAPRRPGRGSGVLLSAVLMLGGLGATSNGDQFDLVTPFVMVGATDRGELIAIAEPTAAPPVKDTESRSDQEEVAWIKAHSGLTWDQLGKVFGVSRRAVHMWANGGRLNESNARRLRSFSAIVRDIESLMPQPTPEMVRAHLLEVGTNGLSIVDRLRRERSAGPTWGAPFGPERLVDAIREPLHTQENEIER